MAAAATRAAVEEGFQAVILRVQATVIRRLLMKSMNELRTLLEDSKFLPLSMAKTDSRDLSFLPLAAYLSIASYSGIQYVKSIRQNGNQKIYDLRLL